MLAFDRRALSVKLFFLLSYSVCYVSVIVQRCRLALNTVAIEKKPNTKRVNAIFLHFSQTIYFGIYLPFTYVCEGVWCTLGVC